MLLWSFCFAWAEARDKCQHLSLQLHLSVTVRIWGKLHSCVHLGFCFGLRFQRLPVKSWDLLRTVNSCLISPGMSLMSILFSLQFSTCKQWHSKKHQALFSGELSTPWVHHSRCSIIHYPGSSVGPAQALRLTFELLLPIMLLHEIMQHKWVQEAPFWWCYHNCRMPLQWRQVPSFLFCS